MWQAEVSTDIAAPIEEVYRYLSDFQRHKEWSHGVAELERLNDGPIGVGTELKATETVPGKFTSYTRITALEPPRRIAWDAWVDGMIRMRTQWAFELSSKDGGTYLVERCSWQPISLMAKIMFNLIRKRQIPRENRQSLEQIKAILGGSDRK